MKYIVSFILLSFFLKIGYSQNASPDHNNKKYNWDLTQIYSDWDKWNNDFNLLKANIQESQKYKGRLAEGPEVLLSFKNSHSFILQLFDKLFFYTYLVGDLDSRNSFYNLKLKELQILKAEFERNSAWVNEQIAQIPKETVFQWMENNEELANYKFEFTKFYDQQSHILDSETQKLKSYYTQVVNSSSAIFHALSLSDMRYESVTLSNGKELIASPSNASKVYVEQKDQEDRKKVFEALEESYTDFNRTYSEIWISKAQGIWAEAQIYGYNSCLDYTLEPDKIPTNIYTALLDVAGNNTEILEKYRLLRKKALKLDNYYGSDESFKLVDVNFNYPYDDAVNIVLNSLKPLGEDYIKKAEKTFEGGWIDVYPKPGKYAAAYNWFTYGIHPFILLNWNNTQDYLFTLSHEIGHAVHSVYTIENQPFQYSAFSPLLAETAAIFNEIMLLDYLIDNTDDTNEKITYLVKAIDIISRGFYRQSQFAEFEYELFKIMENNSSVNSEVIAEKFKQINKKYNVDVLDRSENYPYSWPKIHHFSHSPYYVFTYAVSISCSSILHDQIKQAKTRREAKEAQQRYLTLLKSGGSDYPVELLKKAGVDLSTKEPYLAVVNRMTELVDQLEAALKELGKI